MVLRDTRPDDRVPAEQESTGHRSQRTAAVVLAVLGVLAATFGVFTMLAWYLRWTSVLRASPDMWPVAFNSALGLALTGVALAGTVRGWRRLPLLAASYSLTLGVLTLLEYLTFLDLGIDQLFAHAYVTLPDASPGRVAPNAAVCWVIVGAGLLGATAHRRRRPLWAALSGAIVTAWAIVALFGYAAGLPSVPGWGRLTGMPIGMAAGFAVLGSALILRGWMDAPDTSTRAQWWALPIGLLTLVIDVLLWLTLAGDHSQPSGPVQAIRATAFIGLLLAGALAAAIWQSQRIGAGTRALAESEARYHSMLLTLAEAIVVHGADGQVIEGNRAAERILGLRRDEPTGSTLLGSGWYALHEDGSPLTPQEHPALVTLRTGAPCRGVVMKVCPQGLPNRWCIVNSEPLTRPGASAPHGAIASFTDITDVHRAQEMFRTLTDNSPDFVVRYDRHGRRRYVNPSLAQAYALPAEQLIGRVIGNPSPDTSPAMVVDPQSVTLMLAKIREVFLQEHPAEIEIISRTAHGPKVTHYRLVPEYDEEGRILDVLALGRDLTELKRIERELAERESRYRAVFDGSLVGMALLTVDEVPRFRYQQVNEAMCGFLGYPLEELLRRRLADVLEPEDAATTEAALEELLSGTRSSYRAERRFRHAGGETVWGLLGATLVRDGAGFPLSMLSQVESITALKQAEEQLVYRTLHDDLTGLPNRSLLLEHLANALARSRRSGSLVAVLFLDLDDFKSLNDSFGHSAGDELLSWVAARISASVRASDIAARIGGDEFVVVCEDLADAAGAAVVADQIQRALTAEIPLRGQTVTAPTSIGIALSHESSTAENLLRDADAAMYVAKHRGGRRWEPADASLHAAAMRRLTVEADLRRAVERDELLVHYQPLIELETGRIVAVEALLRWQHPERGLVLPGTFVDIAEERGLIGDVGRWVLHAACAQAAAWQQRFDGQAPDLAVNVSSRQLGDHCLDRQANCLSRHLIAVLEDVRLPPERLFIEVTESQLILAGTSSTADLRTMTERGIRIAVDDFGTGHAGFDYLRRLPVNELKIDKSFIDGVTTDRTHTAITAGIVALGLNLGLTVVAEGVETPEQLQAVREMGCSWGQGWLWHRALPPEEIESLLNARR